MKGKLLNLAAAVATLASIVPVASAATTKPQNSQSPLAATQVWVAKDVTKAFHYTTEYKTYDETGKLIRDEHVTPPAGSLVEFVQEPLFLAIANHEDYVAVQPNDSSNLSSQLESLHSKLFHTLNPNKPSATTQNSNTVSANVISPLNTPPNTRTSASSSFTNYSGISWNYLIAYDTIAYNPYLNVSMFSIYQVGTGTSYLDHSTWHGQSWNWGDEVIGDSNHPAGKADMTWEGPPGYAFTTYVLNGGVAYSGYTTLS